MKHHYLTINTHPSEHWGVSNNDKDVLLQIDDGEQQARVRLTPSEALEIAEELTQQVNKLQPERLIENFK